MKELTKAEEQVMQHIWKLEKGFLKDIVEAFPEPRPAYTTISTVIRVLVKKKFVGYNSYGKVNEYYPIISKESYFRSHLRGVMENFFNGSLSGLASFFASDEQMDVDELEAVKRMIQEKIDKLKDEND